MIRIKRGLDLPITGAPRQDIDGGAPVTRVAVLGPDYVGMKPTMEVQEGDRVRKGQVLFTDKKTEGVRYTAPASGTVIAINRGARRVLQSVVIEIAASEDDALRFAAHPAAALATLDRAAVQAQLVESGFWTALRTRPYGKVPLPGSVPSSIFVTAIDTNPLSADPAPVIAEQPQAFEAGISVLSRLTDGKLFVCQAEGVKLPLPSLPQVSVHTFGGLHPAGNPSTHVHHLDPVGMGKTVWVLNYQDVIAFGQLFLTGELYTDRVVALGGPQVRAPRLVRTRVGACLSELLQGELKDGETRVLSGSVWNGHKAAGPYDFLSRTAVQVTALREGRERPMFGYLSPGLKRHSVMNIYLSKLLPGRKFDFTTTTNGSPRAMVPLGNYERVMPLDILATQLLRALTVGDTDSAVALGALELVEEDLALCTYVCVGKYEYGPILRDNLTRIELEG